MLRKIITSYLCKIAMRTSNSYCIHIPKKLIQSKALVLGDDVEITISMIKRNSQNDIQKKL